MLLQQHSQLNHNVFFLFFREKVCCGTIFKGRFGEVIVDPRFLKPCQGCNVPKERPAAPDQAGGESGSSTNANTSNKLTKSYSDSSSDSGYDESSNQGVGDASRPRRDLITSNPLAEFAMHAANRCQQDVGRAAN